MPLRCIHVLLAVSVNDDVPCAVVVAISMQTVLVHVYNIRVPIPWTFWDLCTCHKVELVVRIGVRMFWERTPHRNVLYSMHDGEYPPHCPTQHVGC
jgi:hypothetical protein